MFVPFAVDGVDLLTNSQQLSDSCNQQLISPNRTEENQFGERIVLEAMVAVEPTQQQQQKPVSGTLESCRSNLGAALQNGLPQYTGHKVHTYTGHTVHTVHHRSYSTVHKLYSTVHRSYSTGTVHNSYRIVGTQVIHNSTHYTGHTV